MSDSLKGKKGDFAFLIARLFCFPFDNSRREATNVERPVTSMDSEQECRIGVVQRLLAYAKKVSFSKRTNLKQQHFFHCLLAATNWLVVVVVR